MSYRSPPRSPRGRDEGYPGMQPRGRSPSPGPYRGGPPSPRRRFSRSPSPRGRGGYRRYSRSPPRYRRSPSPRGGRGRGGYRRHFYPDRRYRSPPRGGYRRSPPRYRRRSPRPMPTEEERRNATSLFIGNLPYHYREDDVVHFFEKYGKLKTVSVGINKHTGQSKGYAFVEFEDRQDAEIAFEKMNGANLEGRKLRLDWDVGIDKKRNTVGERGGGRSPHRARSPLPDRRSLSPRRSPRSGSPGPDRKRSRSPDAPLSPSDKKQRTED